MPQDKNYRKSSSRPSSSRGNKPSGNKPMPQKPTGKPSFGSKVAGSRPSARPKKLKTKRSSEELDRPGVRLNKFLANAGLCSRREADELIKTGAVSINGEVVTEMGLRVMPGDKVLLGDKRVMGEKPVYVLLNKPKDYITTTKDPNNRKTVMHLVQDQCKERVYPVGRLDRQTTGVLLFTNDGNLADKLLHPSGKVGKIYHAELDKRLSPEHLEALRKGLKLEDGFIKPDEIDQVEGADAKHIGLKIHSGKNRIVRRMFEHLGYRVVKLDRVWFAGLTKKGLKRGQARHLSPEEVVFLKRL